MKGRVNELKQIKSKFGRFGRILSGFLAAVLFISGAPTTAFAWGTEGQVCSSKYGDRYVGADGQYYYAASVVDFIAYDDNGNVSVHSNASGNARRKYLLVEADGTERHVFCIEAGIPFTTSIPLPAAKTADIFKICRWPHGKGLCSRPCMDTSRACHRR